MMPAPAKSDLQNKFAERRWTLAAISNQPSMRVTIVLQRFHESAGLKTRNA